MVRSGPGKASTASFVEKMFGLPSQGVGGGGNYPAQLAVAMGKEPAADCDGNGAQNQQLVADYEAGEDHEGHAAEH